MERSSSARTLWRPAALIAASVAMLSPMHTALGNDEGDFVIVEPDWSAARIWNEATLESIRKDFPNPPKHARNLFHTAAAMYSAWCAYGDASETPFFDPPLVGAVDVEQARSEAISFAVYRILRHRFANSPQWELTEPMLDDVFDQADALFNFSQPKEFTDTTGGSPAAVGNKIAELCIEFGFDDGSNELNGFADYTGYEPVNPPLIFDLFGVGQEFVSPNHWQPLAFDYYIKQNGIIIGAFIQGIVAPWGGYVTPFGLPADQFDPDRGIYEGFDPGMPPQFGTETHEQFVETFLEVLERSRDLDPTTGPGAELMDIGPRGYHNHPIGTDLGEGYYFNPVTGEAYEEVLVPRGDYARCLAEFWADGPASETPPGHWHVVANDTSDKIEDLGMPLLIGGVGEPVDRLEWDTKMYFGMAGATHDAAIVAWGIKREYDYARPITGLRYLATLGQSSDPQDIRYDPLGLPLIDGFIDIIRPGESSEGGPFEHLAEWIDPDGPKGFMEPYLELYEGELVAYAWAGHPEDQQNEIGGLDWILIGKWLPYQLTTFVTPAFPGYVSGHSTFSRSAAEYLSRFTGSEYFPGGIGTYTLAQNEFLKFEEGPSVDVVLTWAKFQDAADEAGISRRWGGIHPFVDDYPARILGSKIGANAWTVAQQYFNGTIDLEPCLADLNESGGINSDDLNMLLSAFGTSDAGDLTGDGATDIDDLAMMLAHFGSSCK
ncbi:MAG: DUF6851 domain-containing protein [Phycisphaerales bacterium]